MMSVGRGGLLLGLAGLGAAALHGKREVSECFQENHCSACWAYVGCHLPEKKDLTHG
jgi:hypothetical protein